MPKGYVRYDLIGKRYGRGVVTKKVGKDKHNCFVWELVCDCGNIYDGTTGNLNSGHIKSCGCYNRDVVKENIKKATKKITLPKGHAARNMLLKSYQTNAKKRNLSFSLTDDQFFTITKQLCNYCGVSPETVYKSKSSNYIYNGIDRVNSNLGYELDNVVPCCKRCNQAKNDMTEEEFTKWISRVYHWISEQKTQTETYIFVNKEREVIS